MRTLAIVVLGVAVGVAVAVVLSARAELEAGDATAATMPMAEPSDASPDDGGDDA
jgi:hypothetical protein